MNLKIGDLVEIIGYTTRPHMVGVRGEIIESLDMRMCRDGREYLGYGVRHDVLHDSYDRGGYAISQVPPHSLRKIDPPSYPDQHTAGDWDLCPWKPVKERVS